MLKIYLKNDRCTLAKIFSSHRLLLGNIMFTAKLPFYIFLTLSHRGVQKIAFAVSRYGRVKNREIVPIGNKSRPSSCRRSFSEGTQEASREKQSREGNAEGGRRWGRVVGEGGRRVCRGARNIIARAASTAAVDHWYGGRGTYYSSSESKRVRTGEIINLRP